MNKNKQTLSMVVAAALLSAIPTNAKELNSEISFTPLERLAPEQRAQVVEEIRAILKYIKIDFKSVTIGVDQKGNLVIKGKSEEDKGLEVSSPSCWSDFSE